MPALPWRKSFPAAQDYPQVAHAAIRQMLLQTGAPVYDADGYLQKGVIVRHLALPGHSDDSLAVVQRLADLRQETGVSFVPSLMSQFTPFYRAARARAGPPRDHLRVPPGGGPPPSTPWPDRTATCSRKAVPERNTPAL